MFSWKKIEIYLVLKIQSLLSHTIHYLWPNIIIDHISLYTFFIKFTFRFLDNFYSWQKPSSYYSPAPPPHALDKRRNGKHSAHCCSGLLNVFSQQIYIFISSGILEYFYHIMPYPQKKNTFCSGKSQKGINTLLTTEPNARRMFESNQKILSWTVHIASNLSVPFILWWYFLFAKTRVCTFREAIV